MVTNANAHSMLCDRCDRVFIGHIFKNNSGNEICVGFHRVDEGIWERFAKPGEEIVCFTCMRSDPAYLKEYPWMAKVIQEVGRWW